MGRLRLECGKNSWGCSQPKGHGLKLVDLASKGQAQVLPVVVRDRNMEECIFQVQGQSPVHEFDGVSYEGRSLHLESLFDKKKVLNTFKSMTCLQEPLFF
ncbi:hypothetical protein DPMN_177863 [Dreissena polymorpha]|uniref:Uncharacterized protein n=1 Tax=Dreissena polymorpha TaxID=45954 RepID=A0A9D4EB27_DREPO|nr:hypothetical protein DPMN_177863 [Dreissena polymorpha]